MNFGSWFLINRRRRNLLRRKKIARIPICFSWRKEFLTFSINFKNYSEKIIVFKKKMKVWNLMKSLEPLLLLSYLHKSLQAHSSSLDNYGNGLGLKFKMLMMSQSSKPLAKSLKCHFLLKNSLVLVPLIVQKQNPHQVQTSLKIE